jgi:A/G-specific adenine glycosylase
MQLESPLKESVMEDDQNLWYNLDTEFEGGLATPVQKLLQEIKS